MQLADHMQPGLLKQIVSRRGIADQAEEIAIQPVLILADRLRQCRWVAAAQTCDLGGVRHGKILVDSRLVNHNRIGYTRTAPKRRHEPASKPPETFTRLTNSAFPGTKRYKEITPPSDHTAFAGGLPSQHAAPSSIGIDSIYKSKGAIGAGLESR